MKHPLVLVFHCFTVDSDRRLTDRDRVSIFDLKDDVKQSAQIHFPKRAMLFVRIKMRCE